METKRRGRKPAEPNEGITDQQVIDLVLSKGLSIDRANYLVEASKEDRDKDWDWFVAKYIGG